MVSHNWMLICTLHILSFIVVHALHSKSFPDETKALGENPPNWLPPEAHEHIRREMPQHFHRPEGVGATEAFGFLQRKMMDIGRKMGLPYASMTGNITSLLGDGTLYGTQTMFKKHFKSMTQASGMHEIIDYIAWKLGQPEEEEVDQMHTLRTFHMMANHMGVQSLASQLTPLVTANTVPSTNAVINLVGSQMVNNGMPEPAVDLMRGIGEMFGHGGAPDMDELKWLVNQTNEALRNKTVGSLQPHMPTGSTDFFKKTSNMGMVLFKLPCSMGAKVCFSLQMEMYVQKDGPGTYKGKLGVGPPGSFDTAAGVGIHTNNVRISVPFYNQQHRAIGVETEYDDNFGNGNKFEVVPNRATQIQTAVKLRESLLPICSGGGSSSPSEPFKYVCPLVFLHASGAPLSFNVGLMGHTGNKVMSDIFMGWWDLIKFTTIMDDIKHPLQFKFNVLPRQAYTGFYRNFDWNPASPLIPEPSLDDAENPVNPVEGKPFELPLPGDLTRWE